MPRHAGDVDEAPAWAQEGEEELRREEGAVVVAVERCFDDIEIEPLHRDPGVIDHGVYALLMLFFQE